MQLLCLETAANDKMFKSYLALQLPYNHKFTLGQVEFMYLIGSELWCLVAVR